MCLHDRLSCFADFVRMTLHELRFLLPPCPQYASYVPSSSPFRLRLPSPNCFLIVCLPTLFAAVLIFFLPLTTSAISGTVNTYAFCSWDDIFTQKGNCSSPNNLSKCTQSSSTLSTNNSIEWNLYLSRSNHLVTSFRLQMNVGGFCEYQNKTTDTDRYKKDFFTACVSQVNVNATKNFLNSGLICKLLNVW